MYQDIEDFLKNCRELIEQRKVILNPKEDAKRRRIDTLDKLEYNIRAMLEEIKELSPNDLHSGPEKDYNYPNDEVWIFKKDIKGYLIYIKIKIRQIPIGKELYVISFHLDMYWS